MITTCIFKTFKPHKRWFQEDQISFVRILISPFQIRLYTSYKSTDELKEYRLWYLHEMCVLEKELTPDQKTQIELLRELSGAYPWMEQSAFHVKDIYRNTTRMGGFLDRLDNTFIFEPDMEPWNHRVSDMLLVVDKVREANDSTLESQKEYVIGGEILLSL